MTVMLHGLPGDVCPCPHWGVLTEGQMLVRYADHEEVVGPATCSICRRATCRCTSPGTRLIFFSPTQEMKLVDDTIMRNQRELQSS